MTNEQTIKNKDLEENKNKVWVDDNGIVQVMVAKTLIEKDVEELMEKIKKSLRGLRVRQKF